VLRIRIGGTVPPFPHICNCSFRILNKLIAVQQQKTVTVSVVPPHLLSVHLSVLCPPKQYYKIQLQFGTSKQQTVTDRRYFLSFQSVMFDSGEGLQKVYNEIYNTHFSTTISILNSNYL